MKQNEDLNPNWSSLEFPEQIESIVRDHSLSYMEAVLHWCEERGYEADAGGDMVKKYPSIKSKIEREAQDLNFIKKRARLPL